MKFLLVLVFSFLVLNGIGQKFILLDKTMSLPATLTDIVTIKDEYRNLFAIERSKISEFLIALNKIQVQLMKNTIPESFNFYVGSTRFFGLKIPLKKEERMDVLLTTDCGNRQKITMHLCDAKVSNSSNAFFIKTWAGYIRDNAKITK